MLGFAPAESALHHCAGKAVHARGHTVRVVVCGRRNMSGRHSVQERVGMMRTALIALLLATSMHAGAAAQEGAPPGSDDARYIFKMIDDGYLRLDGRTGQVSTCIRRSVGWACQVMPDERTVLESEIARLQGENAALKKELLARNLPLPGGVRPEPPAVDRSEDPRPRLPDDPDLNKMMNFMEKVWRRLVEMIATLQKDMRN
jgi:hypothetical protein